MLRVGLAATAGALGALGSAHQDVTALLQTQVSSDRNACECLNLKEVYTSPQYNTPCGSGHELDWITKYAPPSIKKTLEQEICPFFFERLDTAACVEAAFGHNTRDSWCFVSPQCQPADLAHDTASVKVKRCVAGKDERLVDKTPDELWTMAKEYNVDVGLMIKWAYPVFSETQGEAHWPAIQAAIGVRPTHHGNMTYKMQVYKDTAKANKPMVFDSFDGKNPFGLVWGDKVWEIRYTDWWYTNIPRINLETDLPLHLGKISNITCLKGCN